MVRFTHEFSLLTFATYLSLSTAQRVGQIGDGQVQVPTVSPTPAPIPAPAPAPVSPSVAAAPPSKVLVPVTTNYTVPPPAPAAKTYPSGVVAPLYTANTSAPILASGTGIAPVANLTAPTVPPVPSVVGGSPTQGQGPTEAGTSAPAVAKGGAERGRSVEVVRLVWVSCVGIVVMEMFGGVMW